MHSPSERAPGGGLRRPQAPKLKLPQQVFLQGFAGRVGELLLAVVIIAGPRRIRRSDTALAPALVQDLDGVLGGGPLRQRGLRWWRVDLDILGGLGLLVRLQHDVAL